MSILAAACCCGQTPCAHQRPFRVTIQHIPTQEQFDKSEVTLGDCISPPSCSITDTCTSPAIGDCQWVWDPQTDLNCSPVNPGITKKYIASTLGLEVTVDIPFVSTSIETVTPVNCNWMVDVGAGYVDSGLTFTGQRDVDYNAGGFINFDSYAVNNACCTQIIISSSGEHQHELRAWYYWRCTYIIPPAYLSVRRPAGLYAGYTWEITAQHFIVRDTGGTIVADIDLTTRTLAQARTDIDALAYVICTANQGAVAADTMPATLMYNRAAAALQVTDVRVDLVAVGTQVGNEQDGVFGPAWRVQSIDLDPITPYIYCDKLFPFRATCTASVYDYTGGQNAAAETAFCGGIEGQLYNWQNIYNPIDGIGDCLVTFLCVNQPSGYFQCNETGGLDWIETLPPNPGIPAFAWFTAFGNRAVPVGTGAHILNSDGSTVVPTTCSSSSVNGCDEPLCLPPCDPDPIGWCVAEFHRQGWAMSRFFQIVRL